MSTASGRSEALGRLHEALCAAGIPIHGVDTEGHISFKEEATAAQRETGAALVKGFDWAAAVEAALRRRKYGQLAQLKAAKAEAAGDAEVAQLLQNEAAALGSE